MEYEQNFGPVPNLNFNANMIEENTISGGRGGRTTRSSRGRSEISECVSILIIHHSYFTVIIASLTPAGKKGVATTSRVISSPEDTPVPTPSISVPTSTPLTSTTTEERSTYTITDKTMKALCFALLGMEKAHCR